MINRLADIIAPDHCLECGFVGSVLCESCYYNITEERFGRCIACLKPNRADGKCMSCNLPFSRAWTVGFREGTLETLVDVSKFESSRRGCKVQAHLLNDLLPQLPPKTVVVPIPTTRPHIRQRGYGHAEAIARQLSRYRDVPYRALLQRRNHSVQHGSSRRDRQKQAAQAYRTRGKLDEETTYLLVDDVYTTGFTAQYAAETLQKAGAGDVWLAVTSRQPLD